MMLLFDDKYAPITSEIAFVEAGCPETVRAFAQWQREIPDGRMFQIETRQVSGDLESALQKLPPLTSLRMTRHLFVPTASQWTAYFDNGWRGTQAAWARQLARLLSVRAMRVAAIPNTIRGKGRTAKGRYGATILEIFSPDPLNPIRVLYAMNDGGRWDFGTYGDTLPFEQVEYYEKRRIKDRFPFELLQEYLLTLGVAAFDETFYLPDKGAILVEKSGDFHPDVREYSLEEARAHY